MTLWGECVQTVCVLATEERSRNQKLLSVSKITIIVGIKFVVVHCQLLLYVYMCKICRISIDFGKCNVLFVI